MNIAAATANEYLRQVAFGANAWHGLLNIHLAYESTHGCRQRTFFQNWVTDERGLPRVARTIDPDLMYRLLAAMTQLSRKDRPRIIRAITQYTDALQHWKLGNELYALAHLYMGVEAITPTAIRWEIARRGLSDRKELERAVLNPPKPRLWFRITRFLYLRAGGYIPPASLDTWARREVIFRGDIETFKTAKAASDKLEHGLAQHDEVHQLATKCVEKCASYLRNAILDLIPLSDENRTALSTKPYATPASTGGFDRQLLATITCEQGELAALDQAYPFVRWEFDLENFRVADNGAHEMRVTQKITPVIGENANMQISKIHFAGPTETTHGEVEVTVDRKQPNISLAGVELALDDPANAKWVQPLGSFILNCNAVRHLSAYWILRLMRKQADEMQSLSFSDTVGQIRSILSQPGVPDQLQEDCKSAWQEVLELDGLRTMLAECATQPQGLMLVNKLAHGRAPLISDIGKLNEANKRIVELGKKLSGLLDDVLHVRIFSDENEP
ncbi:hypothetical protein [Thiobacillus sp.]